jgi:hypothetical protein
MHRHVFRTNRLVMAAALLAACGPRLRPLPGTPVPVALPKAELPAERRLVVFQWTLDDAELSARGEGAARIAPPDSARLDFFVAGGLGTGAAILVGDQLRLPSRGDDIARRLVPPPPLLWVALGRLALPALRDTVARVDGDTVRADIGRPVAWRVTFVRDTLRRVERVEGARIVEWVDRSTTGLGQVRYRHEVSRRQLDLVITRWVEVSDFDHAIWNLP